MQVLNRSSGVRVYNSARMDSNVLCLAGMGCGICPVIASTIAPNMYESHTHTASIIFRVLRVNKREI